MSCTQAHLQRMKHGSGYVPLPSPLGPTHKQPGPQQGDGATSWECVPGKGTHRPLHHSGSGAARQSLLEKKGFERMTRRLGMRVRLLVPNTKDVHVCA